MDEALRTEIFVVPSEHPCLAGHFPDKPVVPGVLLLDRVIALIEAEHGPLQASGLPQAKFLSALLPEQAARIELTGAAPRWGFKIWRDQTLLASGEITS